jgi:dihydroflavonol-4-reductase
MRALVVGGSGFVGLHVVDALLAAGAEVRVTRRKSTPTMALRRRAVELVPGSMDDRASLEAAMLGCDVALVCAGHYPRYSTDLEASVAAGAGGVRNACDAAIAAKVRLVYTSSVAALGAPRSGEVADEGDIAPPDPREGVYPTVKKAMEAEIERARERGLDAVSLMVGGCIGARDYRLGTNGLLVSLLRGMLPFRIDGWINVLSVKDAAAAHVAAISAPAPRYCVAGHDVRFDDLLRGTAARYGARFELPLVTTDEARALADEAERNAEPLRARCTFPRELVDLVATGKRISNARAERDLSLAWTPLEHALDETHEWLLRYRIVPPIEAPRRTENAR